MDDRTLRYWIGFNRAQGIGPIRLRSLIQHFGDIKSAWNASPHALEAAGLDRRSLGSLIATRSRTDLDAELSAVKRLGAQVITIADAEYPPLLQQIDDAPAVLYVKGTLSKIDNWAIAVVGTRRATTYGKTMAGDIAGALSQHGITVISGLARGIDGIAHEAALNAGGRTIAVLAHGIDQVYPPEHRQLAEAITRNGALVTELPVGSPPEKGHFVPRNRIISGLSLGVVVVEAGEGSGALKTADIALDQGREVFAVPGNALTPTSKGTNALIRAGAKITTSADDILSEFTADRAAPVEKIAVEPPALPIKGDNPVETLLLKYLSGEPQHIDDLAHRSGIPVARVSGALTMLEIKGLVRQVGGMQYVLARISL